MNLSILINPHLDWYQAWLTKFVLLNETEKPAPEKEIENAGEKKDEEAVKHDFKDSSLISTQQILNLF